MPVATNRELMETNTALIAAEFSLRALFRNLWMARWGLRRYRPELKFWAGSSVGRAADF